VTSNELPKDSLYLLEYLDEAAFVVDSEGRAIFANSAICGQLGYDLDEFKALHIWQCDKRLSSQTWSQHWIESSDPQSFDTVYIKKGAIEFYAGVKTRQLVLNGEPYLLVCVEDQTSIRKLRADSNKHKQQLEKVLNRTGLGLWDWDLQSGLTVFDERWCEMLGYNTSDIPASINGWSAYIHPSDLTGCQAAIQAHIKGETQSFDHSFRVRHRDGRWLYVNDQGEVVERDQDGNPLRFTAFREDVTERRDLSLKEQELADQMKLVSHAAGVGLVEFFTDTRTFKCNSEVSSRIGLEHSDEERNIDLFYKYQTEEVKEIFRQNLARQLAVDFNEAISFTHPFYLPSGERNYYRVSRIARSVEGRISFLGLTIDITAEVKAQLATEAQILQLNEQNEQLRLRNLKIQEQENLLRLALDNTGWAYWSFDVINDTRTLSPQGYEILGYSSHSGDVSPMSAWEQNIHPDDYQNAMARFSELLAGKISKYDVTNRVRTREGNFIWVREFASVTHRNAVSGAPEYLVGIFANITEDKRQQDLLAEAKEQAESANRAKSQFLATMSHEIRTPMNSVLGIAQLLSRSERYPKDVLMQADKIVRAGQSLQQILNDILDLSKIESGKLELSPATFSLSEMLENISVLMGSAARGKKIELAIKSNEPIDLLYVADQQRLEQVLINLLGNAIKFTEEGEVTLEVNNAGGSGTEARLLFKVADTGIGISDEHIERISQPFTQADSSITRRFGGTGLGLAITSELLRLMGSELVIQSTPGEGSTFEFELSLPYALVEQVMPQQLGQLKVLIAEDHPTTQDALEAAAKALGWRATLASDGLEAVQIYRESLIAGEPFELLILDWQMPRKDGLRVSREIQTLCQQAQLENPPIVMMVTAFLREDVLNSCDSKLADIVINKPVTSAALRSAYLSLNPKGDKDESALVPLEKRPGSLEGIRLLAVDDNLYNRDVAQMIFEAEGARVSLAQDGESALSWLAANSDKVDAVLMDVQMPNMDGLETTRIIRRTPSLSRIPIIGISGGGYEDDHKNALEAGMDAYLTKPIDVHQALETVRQLLGTTTAAQTSAQGGQATWVVATDTQEDTALNPLFDERAAVDFWKSPAKVALYLVKFKADFGDYLAQVSQSDCPPDPALLHKIRGAAATLYLYDLCSALQNLEAKLEVGAPVGDRVDQLSEVWRMTCVGIDNFIAEHSVDLHAHRSQSGQTLAVAALQRLLEAVELYDPDPVWEALDPLLEKHDDRFLIDVKQAVQGFDFEQAADILKTELQVRGWAEQS